MNGDTAATSRAVDRYQYVEPGPPGLWHDAQWSSRIGATTVANPVSADVGSSGGCSNGTVVVVLVDGVVGGAVVDVVATAVDEVVDVVGDSDVVVAIGLSASGAVNGSTSTEPLSSGAAPHAASREAATRTARRRIKMLRDAR